MKYIIKTYRILLLVVACFASRLAIAQGYVTGFVHEQDSITPIEGATISFSYADTLGNTQSFAFLTDSLGFYEASIDSGLYQVVAHADGYSQAMILDSVAIAQDTLTISFILNKLYDAVSYVAARPLSDDFVRVSWSMHEPRTEEDFETGDFSLFHWNPSVCDFPWEIADSVQAYQGNHCMKSSCEGRDNGCSTIEVAVYVPSDGTMRFFSKISSESHWDVGLFFIDGQKMMECSGTGDWEEQRFEVTQGEHVFRWSYLKDQQTNEGEDCFYVDEICFLETNRSFQYFDLFRRRFSEEPILIASHLTDTVFVETNWGSMDWGKYRWGVSCHYDDNRVESDTVWSMFLDKEMTTTFDLEVTTNIGAVPAGATVRLEAEEGYGHIYEAQLDAAGHLLLPHVYRDNYSLSIQLSGYEDYVSDDTLSIWSPTYFEVELVEKILAVDSLYVSPTGWAMWQLSDSQQRGLQRFEIMLENDTVATTSLFYHQFDLDMLEPYQTYLVQVRPVFVSGEGEWMPFEWTYQPCSDFPGSLGGLEAMTLDETVVLSWEYPENEGFVGAMLYRDGTLLGLVESDSFIDDAVSMQDSTQYCLRLVYGGLPDSTYYAMSCLECVTVLFPAYCDPPANLEGENYYHSETDYGALVSWGERPPLVQDWLHFDDGNFKNSIGNGDEPILFWAVRFDADDLSDYQGTQLRKVALYDVCAATYQLWVYVGGDEAPQTLVRYQNMTLEGAFDWHEQSFDPVEIPENEPIWIVVGQQGMSRPAAACADMGDPDGRWVSMDGTEWKDMHFYNVHYTWMLRAFVSNRRGETLKIGRRVFSLQHYHLYRSFDNVDYQRIASIQPVEGQAFYQYYDELTGMDFPRFYYRLTAAYLSEEGEVCESDYAAALHNAEQNFVEVNGYWSVGENEQAPLRVYPNPSAGMVRVEANAMRGVTVWNVLGQCVKEFNVASDVFQIDMSGCQNGVYYVQVLTTEGTFGCRFVLSR